MRQWVDQSRRKIAIALHSLGDEIQPRRPSESSEDYERRKREVEKERRRRDVVNELVRQAREEGVAVDLDELARLRAVVDDGLELEERRARGAGARQSSFDHLVGSDGMLRKDNDSMAQKTTGVEREDKKLRRRGMAGFAAGSAMAGNPFDEENAQVLFDHDDKDDEAPSPKPFSYVESRESSTLIAGHAPSSPSTISDQLIDLSPESARLQTEDPPLSVPQSEADGNETEQAAQSFYSFASSSPLLQGSAHPDLNPLGLNPPNPSDHFEDSDIENVSAGTLTPRSERSAFDTGASLIGSQADDIAILSLQNDDDHDARSEAFSEGGFTDAGWASEAESQREVQGVMTPSSWTDVGSDDESEWGGPAAGGNISQVHPNQ